MCFVTVLGAAEPILAGPAKLDFTFGRRSELDPSRFSVT